MEEVKFISLYIIVVTALSGVVMAFIDKRSNTLRGKAPRKIYRDKTER